MSQGGEHEFGQECSHERLQGPLLFSLFVPLTLSVRCGLYAKVIETRGTKSATEKEP